MVRAVTCYSIADRPLPPAPASLSSTMSSKIGNRGISRARINVVVDRHGNYRSRGLHLCVEW